MSGAEVGTKYVELVRNHKNEECIDSLFAKDAVSVEAAAPPGGEREAKGTDAIKAKGKWWMDNHEVHKAEISDAYPNGDRFAVRFKYEITHKPSGARRTMDEIGLFTVEKGKIVREEFFYTTG